MSTSPLRSHCVSFSLTLVAIFLLPGVQLVAMQAQPKQAPASDNDGISSQEMKIVRDLINRLDEPHQFTPVEEALVHGRKAWLIRTAQRLQEYIDENSGEAHAAVWRQRFELNDLMRELQSHSPRLSVLERHWSKHFEDQYHQKELKLPEEDGTPNAGKARKRQRHAVESYILALRQYFELYRDWRQPKDALDRFLQRVDDSQSVLKTFHPEMSYDTKQTQIAELHRCLAVIDISQQIPDLVREIRSSYLHPKLRVFVSTRALNHLLAKVNLDSRPVSQCENKTVLSGIACPQGHLKLRGFPRDDMAEFSAYYDDSVLFSGQAKRKRIHLGISASLEAHLRKHFYVIQGAADSAPSLGDVDLRQVRSSSACDLVNRLVERIGKKQFDANKIEALIEDEIDDLVTQVANYADFELLQRIRNRIGRDITRVRAYRSRENGIELTVFSSRSGFKKEKGLRIPDPFDDEVDFAISFRKGLVRELIRTRRKFGNDENQEDDKPSFNEILKSLSDIFVFGDETPAPDDKKLYIRFTEKLSEILRSDESKDVSLEFEVYYKDKNNQTAPAGNSPHQAFRVSIAPTHSDGVLDLNLEVQPIPGNENNELLELVQNRFAKIQRIKEVTLPALKSYSKSLGDGINLKALRLEYHHSFYTVTGELDLSP